MDAFEELRAREVSVRRGAVEILDDVSLRVAPGEVLALLGPNGAGKSTLLKLFAGEDVPSAGEVRLNGRRLHEWSAAELARRRAVLPQESPLSFPFRVRDVVLLGRMPFLDGRETAADHERSDEALRRAGVAHLSDRIYTQLSGGERQRVHLARVLAQLDENREGQARYLLLDEPTASLDLLHQHEVLGTVRALAREGVGVLVVLHDLNLAARYADRLALLKQGRLQALGPPDEILNPANIHEVFGIRGRVERLGEENYPYFIPTVAERTEGRAR